MSDENKPTQINDAALYRELSQPFQSRAAAQDENVAFFAAVRELRAKHHIRDTVIVVSGSYLTDGGDEAEFIVDANNGDEMKVESLLAYALGRAQAERQDYIGKMLSAHKTIQTPKSGK